MNISALKTSAALHTFRFNDLDQFRQAYRRVEVQFTPTCARISAEQAILSLPDSEIYLLNTFARLLDAVVGNNTTFVSLTMDDGFRVRINGFEKEGPGMVLGLSGAGYKMIEYPGSKFATMVFNHEITNRGWPVSGNALSLLATSADAQERLRATLRAAFEFASERPDEFALPGAALGVQESILAAIDAAVATSHNEDVRRAVTSSRYFILAQKIEQIMAANLNRPIYSEELASELGVSVRTLHNATLRFRGMSLHRYLRLKRLWAVRRQLIAGGQQIKTCAIANGFWHLGEFAALYAGHFGETPSQTLARSRYGLA
jgi:AraC family ethanolamine operon transcriptional activator